MRMDLAAYLQNYESVELVMQNGKKIRGYIRGIADDGVLIDEDRDDGELVFVKYDEVALAEGKKL